MTIDTPIGPLRAVLSGDRLVGLGFADSFARTERHLVRHARAFTPAGEASEIAAALHAYFGGEVDALSALALDPRGTPFQRSVWSAIAAVPPGETISYAELAARAGSPGAIRAAGAACGANPIWLAIPCHRIIGSDGSLTNYGGGLDRKAWLLAHEGAIVADPSHA